MPIKTRCPICRQPSVAEFRPFCSRGCRDRDLINWVDGSYRVPVAQEEEDSKDQSAD